MDISCMSDGQKARSYHVPGSKKNKTFLGHLQMDIFFV